MKTPLGSSSLPITTSGGGGQIVPTAVGEPVLSFGGGVLEIGRDGSDFGCERCCNGCGQSVRPLLTIGSVAGQPELNICHRCIYTHWAGVNYKLEAENQQLREAYAELVASGQPTETE